MNSALRRVPADLTVSVNVRDLVFLFKTLEEYHHFFHQPLNFEKVSDVRRFLRSGGYKLLHTAYYRRATYMLPEEILRRIES